MEKPDVGTAAFSLLDIIAYLFPGAIIVSGMALAQPRLPSFTDGGTFQVTLLFIVASYTAGFLSLATFWSLFFPLVVRLAKRRETTADSSSRFGIHLSPSMYKALEDELTRVWGKDLVASEGRRDLVFLCWECIQSEAHPSTSYMKRLTTLFSMAGSLVVAIPFLVMGLFVMNEAILASMAILAWLVAWRAFFLFRRQFKERVFRLFFVLSKMGRFDGIKDRGGAAEATQSSALHRTPTALARGRRR